MKKDSNALCYRCERRAKHLETWDGKDHMTGTGPRCECRHPEESVSSCYAFRPVKPISLAPNEGENRPFPAPGVIAGRVHRGPEPKVGLSGKDLGDSIVLYWTPEGEDESNPA